MRLPHWLRHVWGDWSQATAPHAATVGAYDVRIIANDIRTCLLCGRRQMRSI